MAAMAALQSSSTSLSLSPNSILGQRLSLSLWPPLLKSIPKPGSVEANLKRWERKKCKPNSLPIIQKLHVKIGDIVKVISGRDKCKIGDISKIFKHNSTIVVSEINLKMKNTKSREEGKPGQTIKVLGKEVPVRMPLLSKRNEDLMLTEDIPYASRPLVLPSIYGGAILWLAHTQAGQASEGLRIDAVYEIGELFELGIQLSYLLLLLGLLGFGTFFVVRQVLVRRELDLSAKELQEQVRSGDGSGTELFELGAVMLRRKFYPAATKYLLQAIDKWDGDDQDLAQVHNALGVSYVRDDKLEKGISQFEIAVKLQPGYVTAWNNLGDAYEKNKDMKAALRAFEEALLFDPNNKIASPRRDALKEKVFMYKGVDVKTKPQNR